MAVLPALLATCSGWYAPMRVAARTEARARSNVAAITESPRCAAQCNAVMPSPCGAFTSTPLASSVRSAERSPCMAASATGAAAPATLACAVHSTPSLVNIPATRGACGHSSIGTKSAVVTPYLIFSAPPAR